MKKHLTYKQAWKDFWLWIKSEKQRWDSIPRKGKYGKLYLYKTQANIEKAKPDGKPVVGPINVQNILEHHAPDRYKIESHFVLHGKPMQDPNKSKPPTQ